MACAPSHLSRNERPNTRSLPRALLPLLACSAAMSETKKTSSLSVVARRMPSLNMLAVELLQMVNLLVSLVSTSP